MRATSKQYAKSLFAVAREADNSQIKKVIGNFAKILIKNNDTAKTEKIIKYFSDFWNEDKRIVEAEIIGPPELGKKVVSLLQEHIKKATSSDKVIINQKEDKNILGGIIIKYGDKILDSSLRTKLEELRQVLKR